MIGRKSYLVLTYSVLAAILNFIALLCITNKLGPDIYGEFVYIMSTVAMVNFIADLGFDSAHIKRVSEGQPIDECFATYLRIKISLSMIMVIINLGLILLWTSLTGEELSSTTISMMLLFIGYYACMNISNVVILTFFAHGEVSKYVLIGMSEPLVRVPIVIYLSFTGSDILMLALASFLGSLSVLTMSIILILKSDIRPGQGRIYRSYSAFALPLSLISIITIFSQNFDKIIIGSSSDAATVAFYTSAATLLSIVTMFSSSISSVMFPALSQMNSEGRRSEIKALTLKAELYIALVATPILTLFITYPYEVVTAIYGDRFSTGGAVLQLSSIALILSMINSVYFSQINALNMPKLNTKLNIIFFLANTSLLVVFVPHELFGFELLGMTLVGACWASLISLTITLIFTRLATKKLSGTIMNPGIFKVFIIAGLSATTSYGLSIYFPLPGIIDLVVYGGMIIGLFSLLILAFKVIDKDDISYIVDILDPRKMALFIKAEFKK